jgi:hypothetical protein
MIKQYYEGCIYTLALPSTPQEIIFLYSIVLIVIQSNVFPNKNVNYVLSCFLFLSKCDGSVEGGDCRVVNLSGGW